MGVKVHFTNPDIQEKIDQWLFETGRPVEELMEDALAGYFQEQAQVRKTLESRYDEIKSGKVKLIPGDEVIARLRERSAAHRLRNS